MCFLFAHSRNSSCIHILFLEIRRIACVRCPRQVGEQKLWRIGGEYDLEKKETRISNGRGFARW